MIKRLSAHGNSAALIIDKPLMELLNITMETPLEITTDGKNLIVSPVREPMRKEVRAAFERVVAKHGKTLRRLAERGQS
ncbi:MAG: AbrB/MazE/SpoVT family DNA-binding domain-containing protein [Elusimicrobiota bacterium]